MHELCSIVLGVGNRHCLDEQDALAQKDSRKRVMLIGIQVESISRREIEELAITTDLVAWPRPVFDHSARVGSFGRRVRSHSVPLQIVEISWSSSPAL